MVFPKKTAATPANKKRKAGEDPPSSAGSRRQSGRAKKVAVVYHEDSHEDQETASDDEYKAAEEEEVSDAADGIGEDGEEDDNDDEDDEEEEEEEEATSKMKKWRKGTHKGGRDTMEIEVPQARDEGDTPYQDDRLHQNTLDFLKDLKKNNNREWLKWNDKDFRQSESDFKSFAEQVSEEIMKKDPTLPELPLKDLIFRIYRDIRFSPDPTPYKPYFSISWSRTGRKGPYAKYYLQVQPGGSSFIGGGLWHPDSAAIACIREDIDQNPSALKAALMDKNLHRRFFPGVKHDEKKVVAAFIAKNSENALKTKPKGYDADHAEIGLLKLRNFTLGRRLEDKEVVGDCLKHIVEILADLRPWVTYLNNVVMP